MTPTAAGASDYKIIEGANGTWTQNSDGTLVFRANGDFDKFTGVKVDGTLIDAKNYTAVSGSTVITLKADYLKTLSVGTHKLTVVYTDGECSANFEVKKVATEQTKPTEGNKTDTTTPTGATVKIKYDRTRIPSGYTEDDILAHYPIVVYPRQGANIGNVPEGVTIVETPTAP